MTLFIGEPPCGGFPWGTRQNWTLTTVRKVIFRVKTFTIRWFVDAFRNKEQCKIILDGGEDGYGPSFRDEAFGNLVYDFSLDIANKYLILESPGEELWKEEIVENTFPDWEKRRLEKDEPKQTEAHSVWYRLVKDKLELQIWKS